MLTTMRDLLNIFDDIPYKYIKDIINDDDDTYNIEIERLDCDKISWYKTRFTFEISQGLDSKKFVVDKEYIGNSIIGLFMYNLLDDEDDIFP